MQDLTSIGSIVAVNVNVGTHMSDNSILENLIKSSIGLVTTTAGAALELELPGRQIYMSNTRH